MAKKNGGSAPAEELEKTGGGALAEFMDEVLQDEGLGKENVTMAEKATPYLAILQKGSPQVDKTSDRFINGAEQGQILNTVTGEVSDHVLIAHCGLVRMFAEWKSRDVGGGFVAQHLPTDPIITRAKRNTRGQPVPEGAADHVLMETVYHFVSQFFEDGRMPDAAIVAMSSTQLRKSRLWVTEIDKEVVLDRDGRAHRAPSFLNLYKLGAEVEKKDNYSWYGWKFEKLGPLPARDIGWYRFAKGIAKLAAEGQVRVSAPPEPVDAGAASSDDVPF